MVQPALDASHIYIYAYVPYIILSCWIMSYHILADYDIMSTLGDDLSFTTIHYHEITTSTYIYIYGDRVLKMGGPQNHPSLVSLLSMRHPLVLGYLYNIVCYHIISTFVVLLCPTNIRL